MYKRILSTALLIFGMAAQAPPAEAQLLCLERSELVAQLGQRYGEVRQGFGLRDPRSLIEVWANNETTTWTILLTNVNGVSCVLAIGDNWRDERDSAPSIESPAPHQNAPAS